MISDKSTENKQANNWKRDGLSVVSLLMLFQEAGLNEALMTDATRVREVSRV